MYWDCIYIFLKRLFCITSFLTSGGLIALDFNVKGKVESAEGRLISGARITVLELNKNSTSSTSGEFIFEHIEAGDYTISVSAQGYRSETMKIALKDKDEVIQLKLQKSSLESGGIIISARSTASEILTAPQSVSVLEGRQLQRQRGENIMSSLNNLPGVSTLTTGAGSAKPVIRGLTGQRVLVLTDGVRQEEQQFGDDHTVDLDATDISRIEVVKGPASVLYGSDALGGVINIIRTKAPTSLETRSKLSGQVITNSFSNNKQDVGALSLFGNSNGIGYKLSSSKRKAGQIYTPNGRLPNTGFTELNHSASLSLDGNWGNIYIDSFKREQIQDLYNNPNEELEGGKSFQKVNHEKTHFHSFLIMAYGNLEIDAAYQRNNRREIQDKNIFVPVQNTILSPTVNNFTKGYDIFQVTGERDKQGLNLFLDTGTLDAKFHHKEINGLKGTLGTSGMHQRNSTIGTEALIPKYNLVNYAAYFYEQYNIGNLTISAGFRIDRRGVDIGSNLNLGNPEITKNFLAKTGTVGAVYRIAKPFAIAINTGKGFRAPTVFELFANGVHEGTGKYEIGNLALRPEIARNADISIRFADSKTQAELAFFQNDFQNYIYSTSIGKFDSYSDLPIYRYRQDRAKISGFEFSFQRELLSWLIVLGGVDVLRGDVYKSFDSANLISLQSGSLDKVFDDLYARNSHSLPRMTPNRSRLGFRFTRDKLFTLQNPYFSINGRFVDAQNRVDKLETKTGSYNLYDLGFGFELPGLGTDSEKTTFDFSVQNIFNKAYVDHLSRYKDYALAPGINFTFKLTMPFTIIQ